MTDVDTTRLAWDCGDELLERLKGADSEALRGAISEEVLAALQYHSTSVDEDHVLTYLSDDGRFIVVDFQLPMCLREIDIREVVANEIEAKGGQDKVIGKMEEFFFDLARKCRDARIGASSTERGASDSEPQFEFSGVLNFKPDDGGQTLIAQLEDGGEEGEDGPSVFIRLHGWDATGEHPALLPLEGRRASVWIEVSGSE